MPGEPIDWNPILGQFVDKEIVIILDGAPVEPFSAMKGVLKEDSGVWKLLCKSGRGPNGEVAPGGALYFSGSHVRRIMDQNGNPEPRIVD